MIRADSLRRDNVAILVKKREIEITGWHSSAYTDENWNILAEVIRTTTSLEKLVFIFGARTALQHDRVLDALSKNRTIKSLSLLETYYAGDDGAKAVASILEENSTIEEVKLYSNKITEEGAKAIADTLKHNKTLQHIDLSRNNIGTEGAKAIAEALEENIELQMIDLGDNQIGSVGAKAIAEGLKRNKSLWYINLKANRIGLKGEKAIADALKVNKTLRHISLNSNKIGSVGAKAIAEGLKRNKTLRHISLNSNKIGEKGGKHILNALQQIDTSAIEYIELDWNQVSDDTLGRINQEMTRIQNRFKGVGSNEGQVAAEDGGIQGDENASSRNEDEGLTTIHATNASQGDGSVESDVESNEIRHNTTAMETKMQELQSTIAQQEAELARKNEDIAKKDKEMATMITERSQTTREMAELQSTVAQQEAELARKDEDIAKKDEEMANMMMERSQATQKMADLQSTVAQQQAGLALKQEEIASLRMQRLNRLDVGGGDLENYTKCCVCLEPYEEGPTSTDNQRLPIKSATCAHSLCEDCLGRYHASLMNGRSTLRYVRCPQCNDKTKKAFDIQNKVVDFFLREYIQCRKRKRLT